MPHLTMKQERFAQIWIENGGNASEAYRKVYNVSPDAKPNTVEKRACELLKNGKVAGRIRELQQEHAARHAVTVDMLTEKLWKAEQLAYKVENPSAAVAAIMGAGKLNGLIVDKVKGDPSAPVYINEIKMVIIDPHQETEH